MANGDSMDDLVGDHGVLNSSLEPDVNLELEQLKLQQLKLQEEQLLCKHRMLLLKQTERKPGSSTRCIMPDGRIVVRSVDQGDNDADNGTGAGDATKIPGLQSCAICVGCGERAESFCSGCRVTPYCSAACQRRDWFSRHRKVCHNLKRQSGDAVPSRPEPEPVPVIPAPAALRRPRSPDSGRGNSASDRLPPRRYGPPGNATAPTPVAAAARGGNRNTHGGQQSDRGRPNRSFDGDNDASNARSNDRNRNDRDRNDRDRNDRNRNQDNRNSGYARPRNQDGGNRQFSRPSGGTSNRAPEQDEDWGPAPANTQEPKPQAAPPAPKPAEPAARPKPAPVAAPVEAAPVPSTSARPPRATVADVAPLPTRKLTPTNCVTELLSSESVFLLSVDATGESCRGGPGWVCCTGFPSGPHADNYVLLIDPLTEACEAAEAIQPSPGDLFAYLDPSEGAWYRARCLGSGLAALLDASRLVQFSSVDRCSRLPKQFDDIPEYCCLLDSDKVKLTDTLECTVVSKSGGQLTVSLATASGPVGTATVRRWLPEVEAPPAAAAACAPVAPAKPQEPRPKPASVETAPVPSMSARPLATVADVAPLPARKLTPTNCVTELLSSESVFLLSVDATGESCRGGPGWVCCTGFPSGPHADNYVLLIDPLTEACEGAEAVHPRPGDLFAYLDPSEGAWYRARCLGSGLAALLDASRLVQFSSVDRCSRLPKQFADIPEYCCLLDSDKVKLTDTLKCTVVSKSGGQLTVSLATASGPVGTATVRRWLPEVEAPPAAAAACAPVAPAKPQEPRPKPASVETAPVPSMSARPLATVADVAPLPARKLTPTNCVTELLSSESVFLLSVDATGESCRGGPGWVCCTGFPSGPHADNYVLLIDPLTEACEGAEAVQPRPGDLFAYLDPSEGAWYRARCLGSGLAALLDASRLVQFTSEDRCSRLPKQFADIPEYCCLLDSNKVKLADTLECTVVSKSGGQLTVSLATASGPVGTATVRRWLPEVEAPPAAAAACARAPASAELPQVPRPPVTNNSLVRLVDATEPARVLVKPAAVGKLQEYDQVVYDVQQYAADPAVPRLRELPVMGQTVIARSTDNNNYRALVMRVSSKHKRCLLEYIESGKVAIEDKLENMCACPPALDLSARPTLASMVTLQIKPKAFTDPALAYLDTLKDQHEMKLTIPSGANSGPTGTPIRLTVVKSGEDVNRKVEALSTPEWLLHLERGGDVLEIESVHFSDIEYVDPTIGVLDILDCSLLQSGCVYGHSRQAPHAQRAFALSAMMEEYCNSALAKDPYLPKPEELCIAKCPKRNQWLRAVLIEQPGGPGAPTAELQFFDYGDIAVVPVRALRKMMPEFVRRLPAAVCSIEIKDFPTDLTPEQLERARRHMQIKEGGPGVLTVTRCTRQQIGDYVVEAPDLIRALQ